MVYRKTAYMDATTRGPAHDLPKELREVSVVRMTDPTTVLGSIEVLNQDVVNLDPSDFEFKRVTVPLEECCLIYQSCNAAVRSQTRIHEDFHAFAILGPNSRGSINGLALHPYAMIAAKPGAEAEIVVDKNYESVAWLVPPQVIDKHLVFRGRKKSFPMPEDPEIWHPQTDLARSLFELGLQIAEAAQTSPEIFNDNHWARQGAQVEFMDALFASIESCDPDEHVDADKKRRTYSQIVRACEDFTLHLDGRRPYLSELCATANVSERTLQYAFRDIMGMSPLTYLHRLRLHRARDEMQKAKSKSTSVTDVAMNWGFWHCGEFSRAYKNCFGELPSETLKNNAAG